MPALHELLETGNDIDRLRELLLSGENPNEKDDANRTPLHIAVMKSERNPQDRNEILLVVDELIRSRANVDLEDDIGCTPLHLATKCRDYRMIEKLLQAEADINKKDGLESAALHHATTRSFFERMNQRIPYEPDVEVVTLLLRYNPDLDIRDPTESTPLMLAVRNGNLRIVRELLKKNASVNLQDSIGNTAMHFALDLAEVNVDLVKELAKYGGSFIINNNSHTNPRKCYFQRLRHNHSRAEVKKSKLMMKLFMFELNDFEDFEEACIAKMDKVYKDLKLISFLKMCNSELQKMYKDKVSPVYSVYSIASKDVSFGTSENFNHISHLVFDNVLERLTEWKYPIYCDVIVSSICSPYMNKRFAENCYEVKANVGRGIFDVFYFISFYLSQFDMLNTILAFSEDENIPPVPPRSASFKWCSIS